MQADRPKQYLEVAGRTVLEHTLGRFLGHRDIACTVLVLAPGDPWWARIAPRYPGLLCCVGGAERFRSVRNGLERLRGISAPGDWVLVHDAARPCLSGRDLERLIDRARSTGNVRPIDGALLAAPVADTLKRVVVGEVEETVSRTGLWRALTPQMFRFAPLGEALDACLRDGLVPTDECQAMELRGPGPRAHIAVVEADPSNIKVTHPHDLSLVQGTLERETMAGDDGDTGARGLRVGHGFDAHRFGEGDAVVLGGIRIPHRRALVAHSDGDVVIHAVCDALLGAAGLGDIGHWFPDSDRTYAGADSRTLLRAVAAALLERRWRAVNVDVTAVAQAPRLAPHVEKMRRNLCADLGIGIGGVNVKATTTEKMGFTGREEGIACHAVALLERCAGA